MIVVILLVLPVVVTLFLGKSLSGLEKIASYKNESFISKIRDVLNGFIVIKNFKSETAVLESLKEENRV